MNELEFLKARRAAELPAFKKVLDALPVDRWAWRKTTQLLAGGQVVRKWPLGEFPWSFFFDAIHHRGQLGTDIRPLGGKVPASDGPSADESTGG